jgi:enoyl-CoA hydratase
MSIVLFEQQGHIGIVTLNRPEVMNAFNFEMLHLLNEFVESIKINPEIRIVLFQASGEKAFSVGADLKERKTLPPTLVNRNLNKIGELLTNIEQLPQPTICLINGYAFGGGLELALACDFRIATTNSVVGLTETSLGIIPGAGGTQRLPRIVGETKALELILTAKKIQAEEGLAIGLFTSVVEKEQLTSFTSSFVEKILQNAPIAVQQAKYAVKHGMKTDIHTGLQIERKAYEMTLPTLDRQEALTAFAEKRKPVFIGK